MVMFGLSKREMLIKAIQNACQNSLGTYRSEITTSLEKFSSGSLSDDAFNQELTTARRNYFNSVYDAVWASFRVSSPTIEQRMRLAMFSPEMTGLPPEFDLDYFAKNGISAGCTYAIAYFAFSNKTISPRDFRDCSMLNHYQVNLMNSVLNK